jgi:hypothetical protein
MHLSISQLQRPTSGSPQVLLNWPGYVRVGYAFRIILSASHTTH